MRYPEIAKDFLRFNEEIKKFKNFYKERDRILLYKYFNKWRFFRNQNDPLKFGIPWITFPAISYINEYLKPDMKVFEYGSGGSPLFFAKCVKEVISIEHNIDWYENLARYLDKVRMDNVQLHFNPPGNEDISDDLYLSEDENYKNLSFRRYVNSIEEFPDSFFDVIMIDGRA
jgi:hypothetical protein